MEDRVSDSTLSQLLRASTTSALACALVLIASCSPTRNEAALHAPVSRRAASTQESGTNAATFAVRVQNTGERVDAADYPWQVALNIRHGGESWRCGGILISPSFVLTAAHCVDAAPVTAAGPRTRIGIDNIEVFHGNSRFGSGERLTLDRTWPVTFHPGWKTSGVAYAWDAALLRLERPRAAATPAPVRSVRFEMAQAVTSGWGNFDETDRPSDDLRAVQVPVVDNETCGERLAAVDARNGSRLARTLHATTLCALSRSDDACVNDSGGPLVAGSTDRPQTVGIVSWGLPGRCGVPGPTGDLIGAYARASELAGWILETTADSGAVTNAPLDPLFAIRPVRRGGVDR